jgi:serine acetyltransferase
MFADKIRRPFVSSNPVRTGFDPARYTAEISHLTSVYLDAHPEFLDYAIASDPALGGMSADAVRVQLESYPGVRAIAVHRQAHALYTQGKALVAQGENLAGEDKLNAARWLAEAAHSQTGMDIHPGTQIGENCFVDHASGDVIGETARLGNRTRMYHGVTLGALGQTPAQGPRHPQVGDDCVLSMAVKLLGAVQVGNGVKIGPGSLLRGNHLRVGDHVRLRDNVLIEDGYDIAPGIAFGDGVTLARNPHASTAEPIAITRESLAAALGIAPEEFREVPAHSFIQLGADGKTLEISRAEGKWARQALLAANDADHGYGK